MVAALSTENPHFCSFSPDGEDGWHGVWTLPSEWLNLFVPRTFRSNAIRFNTINFENTININIVNGKHIEGPPKGKIDSNKNWVGTYVRHPYEWPRKQAYADFIRTGMKGSILYGVQLAASAVTWEVERGSPPFGNVVNKMEWFYDLDHFALTQKTNFRAYYQASDISPGAFPQPKVTLTVFTFNRISSLTRLINSLLNADYFGHRVNLRIFVDFDEKTHTAMLNYLNSISWVCKLLSRVVSGFFLRMASSHRRNRQDKHATDDW